MRRVTPLLMLLFGVSLFTAMPAAAGPYEFYGCSFVDGKGMSDLDEWIEDFQETMATFENQTYDAVVLTPQYTGPDPTPDFFWMGSWPDATVMGASNHEFFEAGGGAKLMASLAKIATCRASLWWGRTVYRK